VDGPHLRFVYWQDPTTVIDQYGKVLCCNSVEIAADHFRGNTQVIPFDDGWLTIVHWVVHFDGWPKYRHRFVWYDRELRIKRISEGWVFSNKTPELGLLEGYEYTTGLCWHPDQKRLVVGYQIHERESWIGVIDAKEVEAALRAPASSSGV